MLVFPHINPGPPFQTRIESIRVKAQVIALLPVSEEVKTRMFHEQYLKSSLFSARIEGNRLSLDQLALINSTSQSTQKKEIVNIVNALSSLSVLRMPLAQAEIQNLHRTVVSGLSSEGGKLRSEQTAIFDNSGTAVYLTPPVLVMAQMLHIWMNAFNQPKSINEWLLLFGPLHYYFEKIHPFVDGNGRVGRLLHHLAMRMSGLEEKLIIPIDEYFEANKSAYYQFLEKNSSDCTNFSLFLLDGILWSLNKLISDISKTSDQEYPQEALLPRRREILAILADHPSCSMDFIHRRFPAIPKRTIAYDLNWLAQHKLIRKIGVTRGVEYASRLH